MTIYVAETRRYPDSPWTPLNGVRFAEDRVSVEQWLADYQKLRRAPSPARIMPYDRRET
jgi:hypothetical protein